MRELTRDKVGATAELSAVVEEKGHSHPSSVKAYFAVECVFRGMVFHESGLTSRIEMMSPVHFVFLSLWLFSFRSVLFSFQQSTAQYTCTHPIILTLTDHHCQLWLKKKLPSSPCVIRPCFPSPPDD